MDKETLKMDFIIGLFTGFYAAGANLVAIFDSGYAWVYRGRQGEKVDKPIGFSTILFAINRSLQGPTDLALSRAEQASAIVFPL